MSHAKNSGQGKGEEMDLSGKIQFSRNINLPVEDIGPAIAFYTELMGRKPASQDSEVAKFDAGSLTLFISKETPVQGPVLELTVPDVDQARKYLEKRGCVMVRWEGKGQRCYMRDPFGLIFNLWQD
jgi:predicted enzyme related to lactoylglutathione lyase